MRWLYSSLITIPRFVVINYNENLKIKTKKKRKKRKRKKEKRERNVKPLKSFQSPVQTDTTLLANNSQHCWMLHVASVCTPCCTLLDVVAQSLKPVKLFSQQLPTFLLFCDRQIVAQQGWIRLHSSSNIVVATYAHYAWITMTYGLYSSHDALQVPNSLGIVASVCTPLPTCTQQLSTLLA